MLEGAELPGKLGSTWLKLQCKTESFNPLREGSVPCSAVSVHIYHDTDRLPRNVLLKCSSGAFSPLPRSCSLCSRIPVSVAFQSSFSAHIFQLLLLKEFDLKRGMAIIWPDYSCGLQMSALTYCLVSLHKSISS